MEQKPTTSARPINSVDWVPGVELDVAVFVDAVNAAAWYSSKVPFPSTGALTVNTIPEVQCGVQ